MSTILRFKRGTTAELASLTESLGEIAVDTSKKTLVVMDGSTAGGTPLATTALATQGTAGLLSAADKAKLDGLGGTGTYTLPTASTSVLGGVRVDGSTITISNGVISAVSSGGGTDSQTLTLSGTTLAISGGNSIDLSSIAGSANTDSQTLSLSGNTLSISGGNSIDLSTFNNSTVGLATIAYVDQQVAGVSAGAPDLTQATLGQLGNVDTATAVPTTGQALVFDGTNWVPGTVSGGGEVDLTPYFNKQTSSEQIVSGRTVLSAGLSVIPKGAIDTTEGFSTYPSARSYIRGALPGTRRFDADGNMIMDGDNPANFGSQLDFAFQRYGQNADGTIDMNNVEDIGWFGLANWNRNIVFSSSRDGESGVSYMEFMRNDGRLRMRGTDTEIYIGVETDGAGGRVGDNAIVFANNVAGDKAILAGNRTYYAGRGDGLTNIPWTAMDLANLPAELAGAGGGVTTLAALSDVNSTATAGQVLTADGAGNFTFTTVSGGSVDLSNYYNKAEVDAAIAGVSAGAPDLSAAMLSQIGDVDTTAPTTGQALVWNGTTWTPGSVAGEAPDLTKYLHVDQSTTINADQTMNGTLRMNGVIIGPNVKTRKSQIAHMILQSSPEAGLTYSPNFVNDWAYGRRRGHIDVTVSDTAGVITQPSGTAIDTLFDARASYYSISRSNFDNDNVVTIELQLRDVARGSFGGEVGIQFQSTGYGFGVDYCKIEVYKESLADWVTLAEDGNMLYGNFLVGNFTADGTNNGANNITAVRYTFTKTTGTGDVRINTLWCVDSGTALGTSLFAVSDSPSITGRTVLENGNLTVKAHQHDALNADGVTLQGDVPGNSRDAYVSFKVYGKDAVTGITDTSTEITRGFVGLKNYTDDWFIEGPRNKNADGTDNYGSQTLIRAFTNNNQMGLYAAGVEQLRISTGVIAAQNGAVFTGDGSGLTNLPGGTGGGASTVRAVFNPTKDGSTSCTVVVQAEGTQTDIDALDVTVSGDGSTVTIANVATGLKIKSVNFHAPFAFNTTTGIAIVYPEAYGAQTLPESVIPTVLSYTGTGVLNATSATSVSNVSGNITASKGNLSAGSETYLSVKLD